MDYFVDTSSFVVPTISWAVAPYEPSKGIQKSLTVATEFTAEKSKSIDFFRVATGPRAPTTAPTLTKELAPGTTAPIGEPVSATANASSAQQPNPEVDRIAKQRVQLMAIKYAGGAESSEIVARLEILNRRLLERSPRVTKAQVLALESANEQLLRIRAAREERSMRLGITA